eukprot:2470158-Rhodomonas_salina.1
MEASRSAAFLDSVSLSWYGAWALGACSTASCTTFVVSIHVFNGGGARAGACCACWLGTGP